MELAPNELSYHGSVFFTPLHQQIEITVYADSQGPTPAQHSLYKEIELRYPEWIEKIPAFIEKAFPGRGRPLTSFEFIKEFEFIGISIPDLNSGANTWQVEYATDGLDGWISIQFTDWNPSDYSFDQ